MIREWTEGLTNIRNYYLLDAAIEWAEDQVVYRYGGAIDFFEATELAEQALLTGLTGRGTDRSRLARFDPDLSGEREDHRHRRSRDFGVLSQERCGALSPATTASAWRR